MTVKLNLTDNEAAILMDGLSAYIRSALESSQRGISPAERAFAKSLHAKLAVAREQERTDARNDDGEGPEIRNGFAGA